MERPIRCGLRADAVFLFTLTRSFVRSVRKTPDHPALKSRSRIGLHRDGDGAHIELAFPRPNYFRNHDFKHSDRDGLHSRRYAEAKASRSVRHDRRGIRHWIHVRPSDWWIGGRCQSAFRIFDCSSAYPGEVALGLVFCSAILGAKSAETTLGSVVAASCLA